MTDPNPDPETSPGYTHPDGQDYHAQFEAHGRPKVEKSGGRLRDATIVGPYRIEVWEEPHLGCCRMEVYENGRMIFGPSRYTWLDQALDVANDYAERYRHRLGQSTP